MNATEKLETIESAEWNDKDWAHKYWSNPKTNMPLTGIALCGYVRKSKGPLSYSGKKPICPICEALAKYHD